MKVAVLIAVLANLAVFLWLRWASPWAPSADAGLVPAPAVMHPLKLRSRVTTDSGRCLLLAPSPDVTAASALALRLRRRGFEAQPVREPQPKPRGYWVLLGGFDTAAAAQAAAETLHQHGIADVIVLGGAHAGQTILSLGLFRDPGPARRLATRLRTLGFEPQIRERFRGAARWAVQLPATASVRAALGATIATPGRCMTPGTGG